MAETFKARAALAALAMLSMESPASLPIHPGSGSRKPDYDAATRKRIEKRRAQNKAASKARRENRRKR